VHDAEVRVQFSALLVALARAQQWEAFEALWDWGEEWLDVNREELEEDLDLWPHQP